MNMLWMIIAAAIVLLIVGTVALAGKAGAGRAPRFKAKPFMSANEAEFLARLESAVPEYRFHCQVAMGALLEPAQTRRSNASVHQRLRNMFNQKIVDYVAQRRDNGQIVALIELDDRTHNVAKDADRDTMLHEAGYRTLRWQASAKPSRAEILAALVPPPVIGASAPAAVRAGLFAASPPAPGS